MKRKGIIQLLVAIAFFLASWWSLSWMYASAHLAFLACDGTYSLFNEHFRCRQPNIAQILWLSSGVVCIVFIYFGVKNIRRSKHNE